MEPIGILRSVRATLPQLPRLPLESRAIPASRSAAPLHWRPVALEAAGVWLATRLVLVVVTVFTVVLNAHESPRSPRGVVLGARSAYDLIASWARWDAAWYLHISQAGYFSRQSSAFFPLYPSLVHLLTPTSSELGRVAAGLAVSELACLGAFVGIGVLAASEAGHLGSGRAVLVAAAYPLAFFLAAPYTEALFVGLAALTLLCARRGAWPWAAAAAFLAGLTRPTAVILVLPLLLELAGQRLWRGESGRLAAAIGAVAAIPAALACYMAYLWWRFGQPLLFLQVQGQYWKRQPMPPWETVATVASRLVTNPPLGHWEIVLALDLSMIVLFTALTVYGLRKQPPAFTAYMAGLLVLCVASPNGSGDPISSSARFLVAAIPGFLMLGTVLRGRRWLHVLVVEGGFMLQAVLLTLFLSGAWVG